MALCVDNFNNIFSISKQRFLYEYKSYFEDKEECIQLNSYGNEHYFINLRTYNTVDNINDTITQDIFDGLHYIILKVYFEKHTFDINKYIIFDTVLYDLDTKYKFIVFVYVFDNKGLYNRGKLSIDTY